MTLTLDERAVSSGRTNVATPYRQRGLPISARRHPSTVNRVAFSLCPAANYSWPTDPDWKRTAPFHMTFPREEN